MKAEESRETEQLSVEAGHHMKKSSTSSDSATAKMAAEGRDDWTTKESIDERDPPPKKSTPSKRSQRKQPNSPHPPRRTPYDAGYQYPKGGYPPHGRPYPPPYSYDPHYRPPPPPPHHYGQMPPMHPVQGYGYPPPNYHPYGSHPYQGGHMPYPPPPHPMPSSYQHGGANGSDSGSISSTKSKGSHSKKYKGGTHSRKKRTIDGVHHEEPYAFGRTNSSASNGSVGNNTSTETPLLQEESPKRQFASSNLFEDDKHLRRSHRRSCSGASSSSSLSCGGLSMSSYETRENPPLSRASPKRRRGQDSNPISMDCDAVTSGEPREKSTLTYANDVDAAPARFQKLSVKEDPDASTNIFLSLSTSPINSGSDIDATPISKNTTKKNPSTSKLGSSSKASRRSLFRKNQVSSRDSSISPINGMIDRNADTPTPPLPDGTTDNDMLTDEHLLNRHLRGQSFTPLPHIGQDTRENGSESPTTTSNNQALAIQPQLSWSIAGDALSLGDLAEWEEDRLKTEQRRPESTTSQGSNGTRGVVLTPNSFSMWRDEDHPHPLEGRDNETMRLSTLSPNSDIEMAEGASGATTPLPFFFTDQGGEERENAVRRTFSSNSDKSAKDHQSSDRGQYHPIQGAPDNVHSIFVNRSSSSKRGQRTRFPSGHGPHMMARNEGVQRRPPHMVYSDHRDDYSRGHVDRREAPPEYYTPYGMHPVHMHGPPNDRVRNLRGRAPPHHAPMPLQVPPMSSHHTLTSPMGIPGKGGMWGGMHHQHGSPHHLPPPLELNPSKRKCVPLKPPIPSKFQGDIEKMKTAQVPEFTSLVNFPAHMSQKQSVNLPEGMRCCVMCGQACPCSTGNKNKKGAKGNKEGGRGQDSLADKQAGFAIIPTQNKGLCTLCDVNVWVVCQNGLEIKWCKGCKNFRPWAAFGDKGLATKCLRCRERQREKYALQKEEKEKARLLAKNAAKAKA